MVLINLDEADSIYRRAYQFFEEGELDSVASYLRRHINFEEESKHDEHERADGGGPQGEAPPAPRNDEDDDRQDERGQSADAHARQGRC